MTKENALVEAERVTDSSRNIYRVTNILKFFIYSSIGIFMFFIPITIQGESSIALSTVSSWIQSQMSIIMPYYILFLAFLGAIYPFYSRTWNKNMTVTIFSIAKVLGAFATFMVVFDIGPNWILAEDLGPFLFNVLVAPLSIVIPVGSIFLALLVGYGLLEYLGVLLERVMRPVWKTPGRSAVDAVASFVGSPSIGLLITDRVFKQGKYTIKEASIIATGFSAISVPIMIVGLNILGLMDMWVLYFFTAMIITFLVTAITVRIWPLSKMSDKYVDGTERDNKNEKERIPKEKIMKTAWATAMLAVENSPSILQNAWSNLKSGLFMTMAVVPAIMSFGLLGLILVEYTSVFDILGYLFYPLTLFLPEPLLAGKALFVGFASTPMISIALVAQASVYTKFVIGIIFVSGILFLAEVIPVIWSTSIPISTTKIIVIWIQRVVLTLIFAIPLAYLLF